jgi:signal transduction histidine kinase
LFAGWDVVAVVLAATMIGLFAFETQSDLPEGTISRTFDLGAALLLSAAVAALVVFRRWPLGALAVVLAFNAWWHKAAYDNELINAPTLVALFAVGATGDRRQQLAGLVMGIVPVTVVVVVVEHESWRQVVDADGWTIAAILLGEIVRSRRALMDSYRRRAERAESERESEARRQVAEERLRIARDLHDLLGHTVSVMMVQAGVAADALPDRPGRAADAIAMLRAAGKQATAEVRATVELLRQHDAPELAPTPGLGDLDTLVESGSQLGLRVEYRPPREPGAISPLDALTIYRVVQEALTNVVRHSRASRVRVQVQDGPGRLAVSVCDDGVGPPDDHRAGNGLTGLTERVEGVGGRLRHGPGPDGGFLVEADFPARRPA